MRPKAKRSLHAFAFVALLLSLAYPNANMAQTPTPTRQTPPLPEPVWLSITVVKVKPEMVTEFQNFMKNTTNPALRKGGLKWREVWQTTLAAGDNFEYVITAPVDKLAEFDGPNALERGLGGSEGFAAWSAKASSFVTDVRRYIIRTRPDLSNMVKRTAPPKLAVVQTIEVAHNRNRAFENYIKNDYAPVMAKAGATFLVAQTVFGGDGNEYLTITLRESFADLDKGPVARQVLGAEEAQNLLMKLPAGTINHIERNILRLVPELSLLPEGMPR